MTFRIFISSVQDEFAEERRRLKQWLTTDLFVSRFVESVFLFEDVPSRGKPPQEVFLDEVKSSDIYIGFIGSQYYGKASIKRGVSATEQEYDAAGAADCERWVYLKAVDKRDVKAVAFVSRVNRDVTRMIETCRKEGLPDPTWEQNGSSFIVTIWKDMWTTVRLREVGVTNRQMLAMPTLKTKHEMAVAEYMELTGVTRNTATADLAALAKAGIVKRVGAGRGATYVLRKCTINAQNAQSSIDVAEGDALAAKNSRNKAKNARMNEGITGRNVGNEGLNEGITGHNIGNEGLNEGIKFDVFRLILEKPGCRVPFLTKALSVSRATVERAVAALIVIGKIEHRGSKKTGGYYVVSGKESDTSSVPETPT